MRLIVRLTPKCSNEGVDGWDVGDMARMKTLEIEGLDAAKLNRWERPQ
jgi:hypothetical protein